MKFSRRAAVAGSLAATLATAGATGTVSGALAQMALATTVFQVTLAALVELPLRMRTRWLSDGKDASAAILRVVFVVPAPSFGSFMTSGNLIIFPVPTGVA